MVCSNSFLIHGLSQPGKASKVNPGVVGLTTDSVARDAVENLDEMRATGAPEGEDENTGQGRQLLTGRARMRHACRSFRARALRTKRAS